MIKFMQIFGGADGRFFTCFIEAPTRHIISGTVDTLMTLLQIISSEDEKSSLLYVLTVSIKRLKIMLKRW